MHAVRGCMDIIIICHRKAWNAVIYLFIYLCISLLLNVCCVEKRKHDFFYLKQAACQACDGPSVKEKIYLNLFSLPFIGERKQIQIYFHSRL